MSELGDLLTLVIVARDSYRTLHGTVHTWTHHERSIEAMRRFNDAHGVTGGILYPMGTERTEDAEPAPETSESEVRIWLEVPDRARCETTREIGSQSLDDLLIVDGTTWWSDHPEFGAMTNHGDPHHLHGLPVGQEILDPIRLLVGRDLVVLGPGVTVAARQAITVTTAVRRASQVLFIDEDHMLGPRPDSQELVIDAERGIVLRQTSFLDGEPYIVTAFTEIVFDEPIDPDLFVFASRSGEAPIDAGFVRPRNVPLHDVAAAASFEVFAARDVPDGWRLTCSVREANDRAGWPAAVDLHYAASDASANVNVTETAVTDRAPERTPDGRPWETLTRDGVTCRVWDPADDDWPMPRILVFERGKTEIRLTSTELSRDALVVFAAMFGPARQTPPSFD